MTNITPESAHGASTPNAGGNIFFTSDTHFGHANIIKLSGRPFSSVEEMNETIISNFNEQAGPDDIIFHCGDAVMGKIDENLPLISRINARVILKVGNHDRPSRAMQRKGDIKAKILEQKRRYEQFFDVVILDDEQFSIALGGKLFLISHYPYTGDHFDGDRYTELREENRGMPLICGHVHNLWKFQDRCFNVGVDMNDFKLVTEEEVLEWAATL